MKRKILHVVGQLTMGGQETMVMNFCRHMDKEDLQFDFLVYGDEVGVFEDEAEAMGGKVIHTDPMNEIGYKKFVINLNNIFEKFGPYSAIHCHTSLNSGVVLKVATKHNIPIRIAHSHTTKPGKNVTIPFFMYSILMRWYITNKATHLVACGRDAGNYLFGSSPFSKKGILINNGIVTEKFQIDSELRKKTRNEFDLDAADLVVGHVGRFSEEKNHDFLIRVFKEVSTEISSSKLLLIGIGPLQEKIIEQVKVLGIADRVIFANQREDIPALLQSLDVFVFPSIFEGLPVSLVEAQASGLPCIISDAVTSEIKITNLAEFMSLELSVKEWAEAIISKRKYKRVDVTQEVIRNGYDIQEVCKKLKKIYTGESAIEIYQ